MTQKSEGKVSEQFRKHEASIFKSISQRENIDLALYKLNEIKYLLEISDNLSDFSEKYRHILEKLEEYFENKRRVDYEKIEFSLKSEQGLSANNIEDYRQSYEYNLRAREIFSLIKDTNENFWTPKDYLNFLESQGDYLLSTFTTHLNNKCIEKAAFIMINIELVKIYFPEVDIKAGEIRSFLENFSNQTLGNFRKRIIAIEKKFSSSDVNDIKDLCLVLVELSENFSNFMPELLDHNLRKDFSTLAESLNIRSIYLLSLELDERKCQDLIEFVQNIRDFIEFELHEERIEFGSLELILNTITNNLKQRAIQEQKRIGVEVKENIKDAIDNTKNSFFILSYIKKIINAATKSSPNLLAVDYLLENVHAHLLILFKYARKQPNPKPFFSYITSILRNIEKNKSWIEELKPDSGNILMQRVQKIADKFCNKLLSSLENILKSADYRNKTGKFYYELALLVDKAEEFKRHMSLYFPELENKANDFGNKVSNIFKPELEEKLISYSKLKENLNPLSEPINVRTVRNDFLLLKELSKMTFFKSLCENIAQLIKDYLEGYNREGKRLFSENLQDFSNKLKDYETKINTAIQNKNLPEELADRKNTNKEIENIISLIDDALYSDKEKLLFEMKDFYLGKKELAKFFLFTIKNTIEDVEMERDSFYKIKMEAAAYFYNEIYFNLSKFERFFPELQIRAKYFEFNKLRKNEFDEETKNIQIEIENCRFWGVSEIIKNQLIIQKSTGDETAKKKIRFIKQIFNDIIERKDMNNHTINLMINELLNSNKIEDLREKFENLLKNEAFLKNLYQFLEDHREVADDLDELKKKWQVPINIMNRTFGKRCDYLIYLISDYRIPESEREIDFLKFTEEVLARKNILKNENSEKFNDSKVRMDTAIKDLETIYNDPENISKYPPKGLLGILKENKNLYGKVAFSLRNTLDNLILDFKKLNSIENRQAKSSLERRLIRYLNFCPESIKEDYEDDMRDISKGTQARIDCVYKDLHQKIVEENYKEIDDIYDANSDLIGLEEKFTELIKTKSFKLFQEAKDLIESDRIFFPSLIITLHSIKNLHENVSKNKNHQFKSAIDDHIKNLKEIVEKKITKELSIYDNEVSEKARSEGNLYFFISLVCSCTEENLNCFEFFAPGTIEKLTLIKYNLKYKLEDCIHIYHESIVEKCDLSEVSNLFQFLTIWEGLFLIIKKDNQLQLDFQNAEKNLYDLMNNIGDLKEIKKEIYELIESKLREPVDFLIKVKQRESYTEKSIIDIANYFKISKSIFSEFKKIEKYYKENKAKKLNKYFNNIDKEVSNEIKVLIKDLRKIITEEFYEENFNKKKIEQFNFLFHWVDSLLISLNLRIEEHEELFNLHFPTLLDSIANKDFLKKIDLDYKNDDEENRMEAKYRHIITALNRLSKLKLEDKRFEIKRTIEKYVKFVLENGFERRKIRLSFDDDEEILKFI